MSADDRTTESLLARRALAEKATPWPWEPDYKGLYVFTPPPEEIMIAEMRGTGDGLTIKQKSANAHHIAANDPATTMADIDEILRLRAEVEQNKEFCGDVVADFNWLDAAIAEIASLLGIEHSEGSVLTPKAIKESVLDLQSRLDQLEKEADWLAENCWKKPSDGEFLPPRALRGGMYCDECPHEYDCRKCWREAARKAVEEAK